MKPGDKVKIMWEDRGSLQHLIGKVFVVQNTSTNVVFVRGTEELFWISQVKVVPSIKCWL